MSKVANLINNTANKGANAILRTSGLSSKAFNIAPYVSAAMGLAEAIGTGVKNAQINDVQDYYDLYNDFGSQIYTGNFNDILGQRKNAWLPKAPTWKQIRGMTSGQKTASIFTSGASGAMAGAGFGLPGIVGGFLVGSLSGLIGNKVGDRKAKNKAEDVIEARADALADNTEAYNVGMNNATADINRQAMMNITAFGGPLDYLPYSGSAIGYDFMQNYLGLKDKEIANKASTFAAGGPLHTHGADWFNGITQINNGGTHEANPYDGVMMGIAPDGKPNLVEQGEVIFNDYVFSDRIKVPERVKRKYKLGGTLNMTFADAAKKAQKESEERPNDPISQRGLEDIMYKLMMEQEFLRKKKEGRKYKCGGHLHDEGDYLWNWDNMPKTAYEEMQTNPTPWLKNPIITPESEVIVPYRPPEPSYIKYVTPEKNKKTFDATSLRYAPPVYAGLAGLINAIKGSDYSHVNDANAAVRQAVGSIRDVAFTPYGNYLSYDPFDKFQYIHPIAAQSAATKRAIINNSNGNRATAIAGLLGADRNFQDSLGQAYIKGDEIDYARKKEITAFNNALDKEKAEGYLKAAAINADSDQRRAGLLSSAALESARMKEAIDARVGAAMSSNFSDMANSLGDIGREEVYKKWIEDNPALLYWINNRGMGYKRAKGGYLTIKDKRRR